MVIDYIYMFTMKWSDGQVGLSHWATRLPVHNIVIWERSQGSHLCETGTTITEKTRGSKRTSFTTFPNSLWLAYISIYKWTIFILLITRPIVIYSTIENLCPDKQNRHSRISWLRLFSMHFFWHLALYRR